MDLSRQINKVQLEANIESLSAERYTPAGVLVTDLILKHQSEQIEANTARQVILTLKAIAFDDMAYQLRKIDLQKVYRFVGFLANRGRTQQVVLHIQRFEPVEHHSQT
ncbi:MAG: primosomal replication protein N [Shewanella sp.]